MTHVHGGAVHGPYHLDLLDDRWRWRRCPPAAICSLARSFRAQETPGSQTPPVVVRPSILPKSQTTGYVDDPATFPSTPPIQIAQANDPGQDLPSPPPCFPADPLPAQKPSMKGAHEKLDEIERKLQMKPTLAGYQEPPSEKDSAKETSPAEIVPPPPTAPTKPMDPVSPPVAPAPFAPPDLTPPAIAHDPPPPSSPLPPPSPMVKQVGPQSPGNDPKEGQPPGSPLPTPAAFPQAVPPGPTSPISQPPDPRGALDPAPPVGLKPVDSAPPPAGRTNASPWNRNG